jgi:catechol-2,3-dioxygenase
MRPTCIHHIAVKVADLAAAETFYVSVLGLSVLRRWLTPDGRTERSLWLDVGHGAFLALERAEASTPAKAEAASGIHLIALHIARGEREAWVVKLIQAGHSVYDQTDTTIYVRDPEGNRIGLSHWPDPA